jgi:hypothetical protein
MKEVPILNKRKFIFVFHNGETNQFFARLLREFYLLHLRNNIWVKAGRQLL